MAKIKICGIRRAEDVEYVNATKPDFIGFILSSGFRRSVDIDFASTLAKNLDTDIRKIGVFVNEDKEYIQNAIATVGLDIVQLHGDETPSLCKEFSVPVIKVLKPNAFDRVTDYEPCVDYLLFDSGTGTGQAFDWDIIPSTTKDFFLAGGIDSENIAFAIEKIKPFAIDLSSAVEIDGVKDYDKIKEIIDIVRSIK